MNYFSILNTKKKRTVTCPALVKKLTRDGSMNNCSIFQFDCHRFVAKFHQKPVKHGKTTNGNKHYNGRVSDIIQTHKHATFNSECTHLTSFMAASWRFQMQPDYKNYQNFEELKDGRQTFLNVLPRSHEHVQLGPRLRVLYVSMETFATAKSRWRCLMWTWVVL